jgi:hypothetical protein
LEEAVTNLVELLTKARTELIERGHNQNGQYVDDEGRVCALGACMAALDHIGQRAMLQNFLIDPQVDALRHALYEETRRRGITDTIAYWNDHIATTSDVIDLFDGAILAEKQRLADA